MSKHKKEKPTIAIIYDFDGTLAPGNMQEHQFIPDIGMRKEAFWAEVEEEAKKHEADRILTYMHIMLKKASAKSISVKIEDFKDKGEGIELFPGVEGWFDRINAYSKKQKIKPEHYLISSGNEEIIEGTKIHKSFKEIFASKYMFDRHDAACWPALAINYTTKTQFLFRINKGCLDVTDDDSVNKYEEYSKRKIPFENMIFIGDGQTDIPCFRLIKEQGGLSIAVYKPNTKEAKKKAKDLITDGRVHGIAPANYKEDKELDKIIKARIDEIAARYKLQVLFKKK